MDFNNVTQFDLLIGLMHQQKIYTTFRFFKWAAALSALVIIALSIVEWAVLPGVLLPGLMLVVLIFVILAFRILQLIYKLQLDRTHDVNQVESLLWIYQQFVPQRPLPPAGIYTGTPDFFKILVNLCLEHQPKVIVEAGSGLSSVIIAELLQYKKSDARHYALDHLEAYATETATRLANPRSRAVFAPLKAYEIDGATWQWYDLDALPALDEIDLLVIDGPPEDIQRLARFPALPLLWDKLSPNARILLDDAARPDEQRIIELWQQKYQLDLSYFHTEKGTAILKRKDAK